MLPILGGNFRTIKLRPRQEGVCAQVTKLVDYEQFCGAKATDKDSGVNILSPSDRMSVEELSEKLKVDVSKRPVIVDVRSAPEMDICTLPGPVVNVPFGQLDKAAQIEKVKSALDSSTSQELILVCRRGNDSQRAVAKLKDELSGLSLTIRDVRGGLHAWAKNIDKDFPVY